MFSRKKKSMAAEVNLDSKIVRETKQISDFYDVGKELGSGGFSVVKLGKHKDEKTEWALKLIQNSVFKKNKAQTEKEVAILAKLQHPSIVVLKEVVVTSRFFVIVMELLRGGELFDRIVAKEKYSEADAKEVAKKIIEVLDFLHQKDIVHRDLKPENLIFDGPGDDANLKLTDFGFAEAYNPKTKLTQACGTPEYVAPEILDEKPYDSKVDMWSAGVILYILLCGFPPFYGDNDEELFERVCNADFAFISPYWDPVSDDAKDLIIKMLELNPRKRLSASQVLKHKWFKAKDEGKDLSGALNELKRYNATRKFRMGVLGIMAANRVTSILKSVKK